MCTAISFHSKDHYFGRNLDVERDYGQRVVITPKNYTIPMRCLPAFKTKYALIGMAVVAEEFPLYFEATNDAGLSVAGLNFPDNAVYHDFVENKSNITPFELPLWSAGQCENVRQARTMLADCNIVNISFSDNLTLSPLHWLIADKNECIVVESTKDGLKIYDNPYGVLTNNPTFDWHMMNMNNYLHLHNAGTTDAQNNGTSHNYSLGLGALGLPGDFSSASRFVKAAFVKNNSLKAKNENANVSQFFHILQSVAMPKGCVKMPHGEYEFTFYSCCCNTDQGIFYYNTYEDFIIKSVNLRDFTLNTIDKLIIL